MKVIWHPRAKAAKRVIADYIRWRFGTDRKDVFMEEVRQTTKLLRLNPNLGSIDPLFSDRPIANRSVIINGLSKMVYYVDGETIYIVAFWDTRQEPNNQVEQVSDK